MSGQHTPGPWTSAVMKDGPTPCGHRVCSKDGLQVAHCNLYQDGITTLAETEANAVLIAAAPEFEEEAIGVLRHFDRDNIPVNQEERPSGAGIRVFMTYRGADRLRALIEKVRGPA